MPVNSIAKDFAFLLNDVARLLRTYADQEARCAGMTRAQWAVLARVERAQGLKQSELAELLDLQPITLTRLIDRLCDSGLIERRSDASDRRAKRLYLTPGARPVLEHMREIGVGIMDIVLAGVDPAAIEAMMPKLEQMKDNLRVAVQRKQTPVKQTTVKELERTYG
jgi:MarR family transcriptional regulator for hemolysin